MARYIDADALKERLFAISVVSDDLYGMGINRGLDRAETAIDMMPTAHVAPRAEVAREIFEEIETLIKNNCLTITDERGIKGYVNSSVHFAIAELKKKYPSEDTEL